MLAPLETKVRAILGEYLSATSAESVLRIAARRTGATLAGASLDPLFVAEVERGLTMFLARADSLRECRARLRSLGDETKPTQHKELVVIIRDEAGIVDARTRARVIAKDVGFDRTCQAKVATAVSELSRNIHHYARRGRVRLLALSAPRIGIRVVAEDEGPGIPNLEEVLSGHYRSPTGMGLGLRGCKNLMDSCEIETGPMLGTRVTLVKYR